MKTSRRKRYSLVNFMLIKKTEIVERKSTLITISGKKTIAL